jgi:hypothetical protein
VATGTEQAIVLLSLAVGAQKHAGIVNKVYAGHIECLDDIHWNCRCQKRANNGRDVRCLDFDGVKLVRPCNISFRNPEKTEIEELQLDGAVSRKVTRDNAIRLAQLPEAMPSMGGTIIKESDSRPVGAGLCLTLGKFKEESRLEP